MIIAKRCSKKILVCLLCALLALCTVACSKDNSDAFSELESILGMSGDRVRVYTIILPADASSTLYERSQLLAEKIEEKTGVECERYFDNQTVYEQTGRVFICLGETQLYSDARLKMMNRDDYIYLANDDYVIIGGKFDGATVAAIEYFEQNVLPYCETSDITEYEGDFEYRHSYEIKKFELCGFDFKDFSFTCNFSRTEQSAKHVSKLREILANKCGAYPDIRFSSTAADGEHELVFVIDASNGSSARMGFDGEDFVISASDEYGISVLADRLYSLVLENATDKECRLGLENEISVSYVLPSISVERLNPKFDGSVSSHEAVELLKEKINRSSADVILIEEINSNILSGLRVHVESNFDVNAYFHDEDTATAFLSRSITVSQSELSAQSTDGMVALELLVQHVSDTECISVFSMLESNKTERENNENALKQILESCEGRAISVFSCADNSELNASINGVSVCCNTSVRVGAEYRRVGIYVTSNNTLFELLGISEESSVTSVCFRVSKSSCESFLNR